MNECISKYLDIQIIQKISEEYDQNNTLYMVI